MQLSSLDLAVIAVYTAFIVGLALWVSREKPGHVRDSESYFLAGRNLPWWAVGASLIAANISAEQIIGMSGSGFVMGMAIASYEWLAAITLLVVGKYFLPIFLEQGIQTMPQYLERRYDSRVRLLMAFFWVGLYVVVNLTSILWLGALAINSITGLDQTYALVLLGALALTYSLYGGLKAVALTDIVQVVLLVLGGLVVTYLALNQISGGNGTWAGFQILTKEFPEKFDMIFTKDSPHYVHLPGLSVLLGGMWVMHFSYWGCNQYIIQRALAARSLDHAQKGILLAAGIKVVMPIFVVLPGIAAAYLTPGLLTPDQAYPEMMKLVPVGLKGLVFAALIAAILSSLGSMMNSISVIVTMDIFKHYRPEVGEHSLVTIGRMVALAALVIAMSLAQPLLGKFDQAFQFIQEFTGFFTPGVVTLFVLGLFWKKMTADGALAAAALSFVLSGLLWAFYPSLPFIDRVGVVFVLCVIAAIVVSLAKGNEVDANWQSLSGIRFGTSAGFNVGSLAVAATLSALYFVWW